MSQPTDCSTCKPGAMTPPADSDRRETGAGPPEKRQMREGNRGPAGSRGRAIVKALILAAFVIGAIVLVRFSPVKDLLTTAQVRAFLDSAGFWAPLVFVLIYAVGVCLFVPGTFLTGLGAVIFGPYLGFAYVWFGAMLGASGAFVIGRTLGRDFAAALIGTRLKKYDEAIERNGFATVLYLRLVYFPFTVLNFGMGLTRVRFADYLAGTGLGIVIGTFIFTFFIGTLKQVWTSGDWQRLLSFKVFLSLALFIFSFFIPKIIRKIREDT